MARRSLADLYGELFALKRLMREIDITTVIFHFRKVGEETVSESNIDKSTDRLLELARLYGYQPQPWRAGFRDWIRYNSNEAKADNPAKRDRRRAYPKPILDRHRALRKQVGAHPTDLNKAYALLRAHYEDRPSSIVIAHALDNPASVQGAMPDRQWIEQLQAESMSDPIDAFAGYRFLRARNRRTDREARDRFIGETRHDLRQLAADLADVNPTQHYLPATMPQLVFLWLCSREPSLRGPLFSVGRQIAHRLLRWQLPDGSCASLRELPEPPRSLVSWPSALLTVLALNLALVFGDPEEIEPALSRGIAWLSASQRGDGGWPWRDGEEESDLLTTLAATELMKGFSREETSAELSAAEAWVFSVQHPLGGWTSRGHDQSFLLVLAIEALTTSPVPMHGIQHLLRLSREMLFKSGELLEQGEAVDRQLAVIAAHHACEMFLYGYFTSISPEEAYVQPNGQTIGLTQALGRLQERLVVDGKLPAGRALPHRQQVQQLSTARDGIVHRGSSVSPADAKLHVEAAHRFIAAHSEHLLGASLV